MNTKHVHEKRSLRTGCVLLFVLFLVGAVTPVKAQQSQPYGARNHLLRTVSLRYPPALGAFSKGEELVYEVSYLGLGLGTVSTKILSVDTVRNNVYIKAKCLIKTYKGVPFVTLNTIFQSTMDKYCSSLSFASTEVYKDTVHKVVQYDYTPKRDTVYIFERLGNKDLPYKFDTLDLGGLRWQDGLSLLFYARAHALQSFKDTIPVLMYKTKATTWIDFGTEREDIDIDKVDYPIKTVKLEGESNFTGIFGLTGGFEGWFSDDSAAVPIYAKMHVLIGSVHIELIRWKKKGWTPPKYMDD